MKKTMYKILCPLFFLAALSLFSLDGISQNRKLPDGTIVYPDGSRKLPNGTVINKSGTVTRRNRDVRLPGGQVVWREGRNPNERRRETRRNNGKWMPPGQAKKVYGGSARDYAPGQQKKWNKNKRRGKHDDERDDDHEGGRGKHDWKDHKNHKDKDD